jgi:hypothetical protein
MGCIQSLFQNSVGFEKDFGEPAKKPVFPFMSEAAPLLSGILKKPLYNKTEMGKKQKNMTGIH